MSDGWKEKRIQSKRKKVKRMEGEKDGQEEGKNIRMAGRCIYGVPSTRWDRE